MVWSPDDEERLRRDTITTCQFISNGGLEGEPVYSSRCHNCEVIYRLLREERQKVKRLESQLQHDGPTADNRPEGQDAGDSPLHEPQAT